MVVVIVVNGHGHRCGRASCILVVVLSTGCGVVGVLIVLRIVALEVVVSIIVVEVFFVAWVVVCP